MKINKNKKFPVKIIVIAIAILLLLASIATYAAYTYMNRNSSPTGEAQQQKKSPEGIDYNSPTKEQQAAGAEQKNQTQTQSQSDKPTLGSGGNIIVTIPSITSSGNEVRISTLIEMITNTGACTLTLSKDSATVTKQSDIQAGPSSSTCKGFTVSKAELSSGQWQATVLVQVGDKTGSASQVFKVD